MTFTPEFVLQLLVALGAAVSTYAAIRSDLARLHERTNQALELSKANSVRLDTMHDRRTT